MISFFLLGEEKMEKKKKVTLFKFEKGTNI